MAAALIKLQSACAGGEHVVIRLTIGANNTDFNYQADDFVGPIASFEEKRVFALILSRWHCQGMTRAQMKAELQNGIDVTTA
jgi:hypothetical protein